MTDENMHVEQPGPAENASKLVRTELQRAGVWLGLAALLALCWLLIQPILLIMGAIVLATMFDGGARLLGRIHPGGRSWRLAAVIIGVFGFLAWTIWLTGSQMTEQAMAMRSIVEVQVNRIGAWATQMGITPTQADFKSIGSQIMGSLGRVTAALSTAVGAVTSLAMMLVLAIFIAIDPKPYERGVAWMLPLDKRDAFYAISDKMGWTLRRLMAGRLLGMLVEGIGTWLLLWAGGVPMAALLGVLTGILAFLPNIGAIISGILIILVGFSGGVDSGLYAIFVYLAVQVVDGYIIVPMVAKRAVDLAPALVLAAQILLGALFGILGLALADPIVAMIKVWLEERAKAKSGAVAE